MVTFMYLVFDESGIDPLPVALYSCSVIITGCLCFCTTREYFLPCKRLPNNLGSYCHNSTTLELFRFLIFPYFCCHICKRIALRIGRIYVYKYLFIARAVIQIPLVSLDIVIFARLFILLDDEYLKNYPVMIFLNSFFSRLYSNPFSSYTWNILYRAFRSFLPMTIMKNVISNVHKISYSSSCSTISDLFISTTCSFSNLHCITFSLIIVVLFSLWFLVVRTILLLLNNMARSVKSGVDWLINCFMYSFVSCCWLDFVKIMY